MWKMRQTTKKDKILYILYQKPYLTSKNIGLELVSIVSTVSSVSIVSTNNNNNNNNNNTLTTSKKPEMELKRLKDANFIKSIEAKEPHEHYLTTKGIKYIEKFLDAEKREKDERKREDEREEQEHYKKEAFEKLITEPLFTDNQKKVIELNIELLPNNLKKYLLSNPSAFLYELKSSYENFYQSSLNKEIILDNDSFKLKKKFITQLRAVDNNKLVKVIGQLKSRKNTDQLLTECVWYCPDCETDEKIEYSFENKAPFKKICKQCSKEQKNQVLKNQHKPKYNDLITFSTEDFNENLVEKDYTAQEVKCIATNDFFKYHTIKESDEIEILGIPKVETDKKTGISKQYIHVIGLKKLTGSYSFNSIVVEKHKEPLKKLSSFVFRGVNNCYTAKLLGLVQLCTPTNEFFNLNFLGHSSTGKTLIAECVVGSNIKNDSRFILEADSTSTAGLTGGITKNEITGKNILNNSVLLDAHKEGIFVINELNTRPDLANTLNPILGSKLISINKTGIKSNFGCEAHSIITANEIKANFRDPSSLERTFGFHSRFFARSFNVFFPKREVNFEQQREKYNYFSLNEEEQQQLINCKSYFLHARRINPKISTEDKKRLTKIFNTPEIKNATGELDNRLALTILTLLKGICRVNLRETTKDSDFAMLTDVLMSLNTLKTHFFNDLSGDVMEYTSKYFSEQSIILEEN